MPRVLDPCLPRLHIRFTKESSRTYVAHERQFPRLSRVLAVHERHHVDGKTVATPYWTGMMLFSIDSRGGQRKKHNMLQRVYGHEGRVSFKGQIFSAPMNWNDTLEQLRKIEANESHVSLPVQGAVLAARVRISISAGLVDLNRLIRQATVRRNIVVQLIRMHRDAGHPDYVGLDMRGVERRAQTLASSDEPSIPNELAELFEMGSEEEK